MSQKCPQQTRKEIMTMQEAPRECPKLQLREFHQLALVANYQKRLLRQQRRQQKELRRLEALSTWTHEQDLRDVAGWMALFDDQRAAHQRIVTDEFMLRVNLFAAAVAQEQKILDKELEEEDQFVIVSGYPPCDATLQRARKEAACWTSFGF